MTKAVLKILKAKAWVGLDKYTPINVKHLVRDLTPVKNEVLNRENGGPIYYLNTKIKTIFCHSSAWTVFKIAYLNIGGTKKNEFYKSMSHYAGITEIQIPRSLKAEDEEKTIDKIKSL